MIFTARRRYPYDVRITFGCKGAGTRIITGGVAVAICVTGRVTFVVTVVANVFKLVFVFLPDFLDFLPGIGICLTAEKGECDEKYIYDHQPVVKGIAIFKGFKQGDTPYVLSESFHIRIIRAAIQTVMIPIIIAAFI